jgi:hypothetical protein
MLNIDTNAKEIHAELNRLPASQIPFARSLIANRMAQKVRDNEIAVMRSRFDRPTPWTLNSLYLKAATKAKPSARVWFKDFAPKGTPANTYLQPEVFGGSRNPKRLEKAMQAMGYLKQGEFLVPAQGAKLDTYGNMQRGQIVQILSAFRAFSGVGFNANATGSQRSQRKQTRSGAALYFWGTVHGETGIWQRVNTSAFGKGARPIMLVTNGSPKYRVRFPFFAIAENTVAANYQTIATKAIDETLRTMRKP